MKALVLVLMLLLLAGCGEKTGAVAELTAPAQTSAPSPIETPSEPVAEPVTVAPTASPVEPSPSPAGVSPSPSETPSEPVAEPVAEATAASPVEPSPSPAVALQSPSETLSEPVTVAPTASPVEPSPSPAGVFQSPSETPSEPVAEPVAEATAASPVEPSPSPAVALQSPSETLSEPVDIVMSTERPVNPAYTPVVVFPEYVTLKFSPGEDYTGRKLKEASGFDGSGFDKHQVTDVVQYWQETDAGIESAIEVNGRLLSLGIVSSSKERLPELTLASNMFYPNFYKLLRDNGSAHIPKLYPRHRKNPA